MHPTVKPVALIADAISDCSRRGELVLDCFGGSGSTLIAAEKAGRCARLIEYDPLDCDTISQRWESPFRIQTTLCSILTPAIRKSWGRRPKSKSSGSRKLFSAVPKRKRRSTTSPTSTADHATQCEKRNILSTGTWSYGCSTSSMMSFRSVTRPSWRTGHGPKGRPAQGRPWTSSGEIEGWAAFRFENSRTMIRPPGSAPSIETASPPRTR